MTTELLMTPSSSLESVRYESVTVMRDWETGRMCPISRRCFFQISNSNIQSLCEHDGLLPIESIPTPSAPPSTQFKVIQQPNQFQTSHHFKNSISFRCCRSNACYLACDTQTKLITWSVGLWSSPPLSLGFIHFDRFNSHCPWISNLADTCRSIRHWQLFSSSLSCLSARLCQPHSIATVL